MEKNICPHSEYVWVAPKERSNHTFEYREGCYKDIWCHVKDDYCDMKNFGYEECIIFTKWDKE